MAKYRSLEPVAYVNEGAIVSVAADRFIELDDDQATSLAGKVVRIDVQDSIFPDGAPYFEPAFVRAEIPTSEVAVEAPAKKGK